MWSEGAWMWHLCRTAAVIGTACVLSDEGVRLCSVAAGGTEWLCGARMRMGPEDSAGCVVVVKVVDNVVIAIDVLVRAACMCDVKCLKVCYRAQSLSSKTRICGPKSLRKRGPGMSSRGLVVANEVSQKIRRLL